MENIHDFIFSRIRVFTVIIILILFCSSGFAQATSSLGDVNVDGTINSIDALSVAQYVVGILASLPSLNDADVNADGTIDSIDALLIAQYYTGIITSFPGNPTPGPTQISTPTPTVPPGGIPEPMREVQYYDPIVLQYAEVVKITGFDFIFRFSDINDSRCPEDVVCVWEGEAVVFIDCWTESRYLGVIEIKAPPAEPQSGGVTGNHSYYYRFTCTAVDPYPNSPATTLKEDYTVTLECVIAIP
jgi:hypothetical protein